MSYAKKQVRISYIAQYITELVADFGTYDGPYAQRAIALEKRWYAALDEVMDSGADRYILDKCYADAVALRIQTYEGGAPEWML